MDLFCKKQTFSDTPQRHGAVKRHASGEELARRQDEGGQKVKGEPKPGLPSFRAKKPGLSGFEYHTSPALSTGFWDTS